MASHQFDADEHRRAWDERHKACDFEGRESNPTLMAAAELGAELTASDADLELERAEVVRQVAPPGSGPIDALLVLLRRATKE